MPSHRISKKRRRISMAVAGVAVLAGGAFAAEAATATTVARPAPKIYTGHVFDTCTAPSLTTMKGWYSSSVYHGAAVYVGGKNRGCAQPNLTASWVKAVSATGWKLVPLYVGAQPPCQTSANPEKMTAANATSLAVTDANDAVAKEAALGMKPGSPVYLDMEYFDPKNTSCVNTVLSYIRSFDKTVKAKGYWSGFYGFSNSSAAVVANATNRTDLPEILWYARYDDVYSTTTGFPYASTLYTGHRRGHQYAVNKKVTHTGGTLTIDRNAWDAPVAIVGS
ncbi:MULTISPECIES: glycoside hydrolase domain-containing protein [unclassified Streptomyces]|uniref:glycoside hydrolase domain-containing protein n=1 Tax=unclassified Streptomyces TaxID=2593676 RepID=UPI002DD8DA57|nr:glycoside hydrolase domain-containing protein [Streptomyces sp. NBC_01800]WSA68630.1 DUF1906 domain-containing protein [Streptomyces sp. NBC_01800]WSA77243.1 DUF1906 domain-containing protein [Streptomyces sp. NBC_01799]